MEIINLTINAIKQIKGPDYFRNEKKFIAKFKSKLTQQLKATDLYPRGTKLEFLKLKSNPDHRGFRMRRVLVLHIPNKKGSTQDSNENNFVVFAFYSGRGQVKYRNTNYTLHQMFGNLNYKTGIIINIGNYPDSYIWSYGDFNDRIHELSTASQKEHTQILHTYIHGIYPTSKVV